MSERLLNNYWGDGMDEYFDLQNYLIKGVESIVADAVKATLRNPKESAFMLRLAAASRAASKKRRKAEDKDKFNQA